MVRLVMTGVVSLSLLVATTAQQKSNEKDGQQADQTERANKLGKQGDSVDNGQPTAEQNQRTELPELFKQLDLNEAQKEQLLVIYRDSDQKSQQVWDRVQELHREAISMEAAAIAAARLEGHDHSAHANKAGQPNGTETVQNADPTEPKASPAVAEEADDREKKTSASDTNDNTEKGKTGKNTDQKGAHARQTSRRANRAADKSSTSDKDSSAAWPELDGELSVVAIRVGIAQPDGRVREYLLTQPNSHADTDSDPAFNSYTSQLTQVWKDIHDGHEELVELEADTIVKVEAQLTEAQLKQLDATQSQASNTSKSPNDDSRR